MILIDEKAANPRLYDPAVLPSVAWPRAKRAVRVRVVLDDPWVRREVVVFLERFGHVVVDDEEEASVMIVAQPHWPGAGVDRVILLSSIEAAGPVMHDQAPVFEGAQDAPVTERGRDCLIMEKAAMAHRGRTGCALVILRAGHLYGGGRLGCLTPLFLHLLSGREHALIRTPADRRLQPLHVEDLAQAAACAVSAGEWINTISDGTHPTVGDLLRALSLAGRRTGYEVPSWPGSDGAPTGARVHYAHPHHRAGREMGYEPRWKGGSGIDELLYALRFRQLRGGWSADRLAEHILALDEERERSP